MGTAVRVLMILDSPETAQLLVRELTSGGYDPIFERAASPEELDRALAGDSWDVILSDYDLRRFGALDALAILKGRDLDVPFIIVSDTVGEAPALGAIKAGADNCIRLEALISLAPTVERGVPHAASRHGRTH